MNPTEVPACVLLNPLYAYADGSIYKEVSNLDPPLGLAALSAYVTAKGFPCFLYDLNVEAHHGLSVAGFLKEWKQKTGILRPFIGITCVTTFAYSTYSLAQTVKEIFPESVVIAGGPHATFMPREVLACPFIDLVVMGEGELTLEEILKGLPYSEIQGLAFKTGDGSGIQINLARPRIKDLDSLPIPAYHQLQLSAYQPVLGSYKRLPAANMVTSRGCPGRCTFCCRTFGNQVTYNSPARILQEIEGLITNYGIRQINFYDDTFTLNKSRVIELCQGMIARKLEIDWTCFARLDRIDEEMLHWMKKAGCYQVMYGVENFDPGILSTIKKAYGTVDVKKVVRMTRKAGIRCRLSILIGNPGETKETVMNNIRQMNRLNPDILVVNITTPFPGTEMYDWALKENRLLTTDWKEYDGKQAVMRIDTLSTQEIYTYYHKMYARFYLRPVYVLTQLARIRSWLELRVLFHGFFSLLRFSKKRTQGLPEKTAA